MKRIGLRSLCPAYIEVTTGRPVCQRKDRVSVFLRAGLCTPGVYDTKIRRNWVTLSHCANGNFGDVVAEVALCIPHHGIYCSCNRATALAMLEVVTPTCRAISAIDN